MLRYINTDIVFQEFPDEVTLAINISGCPCRCPGCHSQFLWANRGEELTAEALSALIRETEDTITCVGFMGGWFRPCGCRYTCEIRPRPSPRFEDWLVHWAHSNLSAHRPTAFWLYQSGTLSPPPRCPRLSSHQSADVPPLYWWQLWGYHLSLLESQWRQELIKKLSLLNKT